MKEKLYSFLPNVFQNLLISLFNFLAYRKRYGGKYNEFLELFAQNRKLSEVQLIEQQTKRYEEFLKYVTSHSNFYKELYKDIEEVEDIQKISSLPVVTKEMFRMAGENLHTIRKAEGIISKTGGTTGKSLEVLFTPIDMQERFAMLDDFRGRFGYQLGKKTAWFSGKSLLTKRDIKKNRFWKTDFLYKVRYYSTFHIKESYLGYYIEDLIKYKPSYMVGFPSTILEIARYGLKKHIDFPEHVVKAIFPTAETVNDSMREVIELFFKTKVYDQYASSEGAPFIIECEKGKLHMELQSGVFEVLNSNDLPVTEGRLIVTSFTTKGSPLIRYDIGDEIELSNETCDCGNHNPLVKKILGRIDDYIYSPEIGKINLGNVSNTLKDTKGIVKFQAIQEELNAIEIKLVIDKEIYNDRVEEKFLQNWKDRVGNNMHLKLNYVEEIPVEKSGKFRIVKNNIKHLLD